MPPAPLYVTTDAFRRTMRLLIANFEPTLDDARADTMEALYRRSFTDRNPLRYDVQDDVLERAIAKLITHRQDRGMPRVAEVAEVVDAERDLDTLYRSQRHIAESLRALSEALQEPAARARRRKVLEQCVERVARTLGDIQALRAQERLFVDGQPGG